jgi:hypothetical protein
MSKATENPAHGGRIMIVGMAIGFVVAGIALGLAAGNALLGLGEVSLASLALVLMALSLKSGRYLARRRELSVWEVRVLIVEALTTILLMVALAVDAAFTHDHPLVSLIALAGAASLSGGGIALYTLLRH